MTDIVKKVESVDTDLTSKTSRQIKLPSLQARLQKAKEKLKEQATSADATTMKNRIALILDASGSMGNGPDSPIESLKQAVELYVNHCDMNDTSVALIPFGHPCSDAKPTALTCDKTFLCVSVSSYRGSGGTPMGDALKRTIEGWPITRAVLVSDGFPNNVGEVYEAANAYVETKTPVDCVHIGLGGGHEVMKRVAEMTGGIYVNFKDIHTFVQSFKYLTPGLRGMLMSGDAAALLGTDEVKI
jgi:uncharacterized protein YegL